MISKLVCIFLISLLVTHESNCGLSASFTPQVTDADLETFSETLIRKDVPNEFGQVRINLQTRIPYQSNLNTPAHNPLLEYTATSGRREPDTYRLLRQLFQAYERGGNGIREKENFLNTALETEVMKETVRFLNNHGVRMAKEDLKRYLDTIWFTSYHRGQGIQSSGFKHVFMAEIKNNDVKGLHNWLFYLDQQDKGNLNYIGYSKNVRFGGFPSSLVKIRYQWLNVVKPSGSMFVSTSPELEMALYSICFLYRQQQDCNVSLGNSKVHIKTHKFDVRGVPVIGSAYPT